jgi:hypothetical protein
MFSKENLKHIQRYCLYLNDNEALNGDDIAQINMFLKVANGDKQSSFELLQDVVQELDNSELQELITLAEKELRLSETAITEGMEVRK